MILSRGFLDNTGKEFYELITFGNFGFFWLIASWDTVSNYERSFYLRRSLGSYFYDVFIGWIGSSGTNNSSTLILGSILIDPSLIVLELTTDVLRTIFEGSKSFIEVS